MLGNVCFQQRSTSGGSLPLILLFFIIPSFIVGCDSNSSSSSAPHLEQQFEAILVENMEEFGIPGALVAVSIPGREDFLIEMGVADIASATSIDSSDHVRIGSVTKSFTVTVILQLVGEERLRLEDSVSSFFPDIQNGEATVRELADMKSGIFNYTEDTDFVLLLIEDLLRMWSPQELVNVAERNSPYFAPGVGWHYSNTNTVLLGMLIEQVTGNPVGVEIQQRIIEPLGLGNTFYPSTADIPLPFASGYADFGQGLGLQDVSASSPSSSAASGAMLSRLGDLRLWASALGKGTLLDPSMQQARIASLAPIEWSPCDDRAPGRQPRHCPEYDKYGMGIGELSGWIRHTGEGIGYTLLVMFNPENDASVVIIMNRSSVGEHVPTKVFRQYAELLGGLNG